MLKKKILLNINKNNIYILNYFRKNKENQIIKKNK